eukprot:COSAG02_NODE_29485_length_568_cov_0.980810_1_plen_58_part_10
MNSEELNSYIPSPNRHTDTHPSSREHGGLAQPVSHPLYCHSQTPPKTLVRRVLLFSET